MKHEPMRELLALRLYGELDTDEREQLERHLATCEDCRGFERELEAGLGSLPAASERELPWDGRWRPSWAASRWRSLPLWTAAAGFAACALILSALGWGPRPAQQPRGEGEPTPAGFSRDRPPPAAQSIGAWGQWLDLRRQ